MIEDRYVDDYIKWLRTQYKSKGAVRSIFDGTSHKELIARKEADFMFERRSFLYEKNEEDFSHRDCVACGMQFLGAGRRHTCRCCEDLMKAGEKPKFQDAKQVILIRKDIQMPAGKLGAQVAHASVACVMGLGTWEDSDFTSTFTMRLHRPDPLESGQLQWFRRSFPKITLEVKNETQMKKYHDLAVAAGLPVSWIVDAGRTVFNGVATPTVCGIGPAPREMIDAITGKLRVYQ